MFYDWLILLGVLFLIVGIFMVGGALGGFFGLEKKTDKKNWLWFIGVSLGVFLALVGLVLIIAGIMILNRSTVKTFGALMTAGVILMVFGIMFAVGGGTAGGIAEKKTGDRQWFWLIGSGIVVGSLLFILGIGLLIPAIVIAVRNKKGYEPVPDLPNSKNTPCDVDSLSSLISRVVIVKDKQAENKGANLNYEKAIDNQLKKLSGCDEGQKLEIKNKVSDKYNTYITNNSSAYAKKFSDIL
jgi:MFS family permease